MPESPQRRRELGAVLAAALIATIVTAAVSERLHRRPGDDGSRVGLLREVFDEAADHCYVRYREHVAQLQACLMGAMQAHLQALGGADGPSLPPDDERAPATQRRPVRPAPPV